VTLAVATEKVLRSDTCTTAEGLGGELALTSAQVVVVVMVAHTYKRQVILMSRVSRGRLPKLGRIGVHGWGEGYGFSTSMAGTSRGYGGGDWGGVYVLYVGGFGDGSVFGQCHGGGGGVSYPSNMEVNYVPRI